LHNYRIINNKAISCFPSYIRGFHRDTNLRDPIESGSLSANILVMDLETSIRPTPLVFISKGAIFIAVPELDYQQAVYRSSGAS
jgi:hypothetical protein